MLKSILKKDNSINVQPSTKKVVFSKKIKYKTIPNRFDINNVPVSETFGTTERVIQISKPLTVKSIDCKNIFPDITSYYLIIIFIIFILFMIYNCKKSNIINYKNL